jgi:murein DD-endopeptidase MepM/ murein hydrolase activator NlpD
MPNYLKEDIFIDKHIMGQKLIITESDRNHIQKLHRLNEKKELDVFPIDGGFNIGYDKNWNDWDDPQGTANSDFSKSATGHGAGGHPHGHFGIDIFGQRGTPIVAPVDGKVKLNFGNGNTVIIEDLDGYSHWLGHLDSITIKDGEMVEAGTKVGTLGDTGNAKGTAPHLHYNVYPTKQGFYSAEDPIEDLKDAIGKRPGFSSGKGIFNFTDIDDKVIDGIKSLYNKSTGSSTVDKATASVSKPYVASTSDEILSIIKSKGSEFIKGLKNMFT